VGPEVIEKAECDCNHLGEVPSEAGAHAHVGKRTRASQNILPAMRRELMVQFGGCCAVEGCHNQTYLDLHHLSYPQPGKRPEPGSIIVLCGAHHDHAHRGSLVIDRDADGKLRFHHADGRRYGALQASRSAEDALCKMGFGRAEVRAVLVGAGGSLEEVIRKALGALTANRTDNSGAE